VTTPTLRFDRITERWVSVAPARAFTASSVAGTLPTLSGPCPFCPGHESATERSVYALPSEAAWQVRVVENRYPVTTSVEGAARLHPSVREAAAAGLHEVVVESRDHDGDLGDYSLEQCTLAMRAYRDRVRALEALPWAHLVAVFRNRGRRAGSSQPHPHGQIVALAARSDEVELRYALARSHAEQTGHSLLDEVVEQELAAGERIIESTEHFVVLCPFASHRRFELWIVPRSPIASLGALDDAHLAPLASILGRSARRLARATNGADYNLVVRSAPPRAPSDAAARTWIEILPRTGGPAGYELATGIDIVTLRPEDAAARLRSVSGDGLEFLKFRG